MAGALEGMVEYGHPWLAAHSGKHGAARKRGAVATLAVQAAGYDEHDRDARTLFSSGEM